MDAVGIAKLYFNDVFKQFGLHKKVVSDCTPQFILAFARELAGLLQYNMALSSAYHPQTDGEIKCYNQELKTYLHIFCEEKPQKRLELLSMAEFTHNTTIHLVIGKFPFFLIMENELQSNPPLRRTFLPALEQWHNQIEDTQKEAKSVHKLIQQHMKEWTFSCFISWKVEDKVWLKITNLKLQVPSRKLSTKQTDPFEITQVISSIAFWLKLPKQWKIHDMFHASLLSSYRETLEYSPNFPQPPLELIGIEDEYKIDKIINYCYVNRCHLLRVYLMETC